ncbi:MAG: hypothetical protein HC896_03345 [Bacteroidales bacterium]|nr:hypothetical protein [Bacteroidales bacterium]
MSNIVFLRYEEINLFKWDQCVDKAFNGSIFAYSWYLNIVSNNWCALVKGDYEAVMPLPVKRLLSVEGLEQPRFSPELGIFSTDLIDDQLVKTFMKAIPGQFKFLRIHLNKNNPVNLSSRFIGQRLVYEIDLISPYTRFLDDYSVRTKVKIAKARNNKIYVIKGLMPNEFVDLIKASGNSYTARFTTNDYNKLRILASTAVKYRLGQVYAAYDQHNSLCAASLFIWSHRKVTLLFSAVNKDGLRNHALDYIVNQFIEEHSSHNLTLSLDNEFLKRNKINCAGFGAKPFRHAVLTNRFSFWSLFQSA